MAVKVWNSGRPAVNRKHQCRMVSALTETTQVSLGAHSRLSSGQEDLKEVTPKLSSAGTARIGQTKGSTAAGVG